MPISNYGIHFIVEPAAPVLSDKERGLLEELKPAGVMFRKRNFLTDAPYSEWLAAYRCLLESIRKAVGREPLLVGIDHEGGAVHRFPEPITRFPYAAKWGQAAAEVAKAMGIELRSLGINVSFAPVLDIHSNPSNPVINMRALATDKDQVIKYALSFIEALESVGVKACGKHFPGHGDTDSDSHWALPVLNHDLSLLRSREFAPFSAAIEAGLEMIMTAHLMVPEIDADCEATISEACMNRLLRGDLGFSGLIVTDAIGMAAILDRMKAGAAVQAINAGVDLICVAGDSVSLEAACGFARDLEHAASTGDLNPDMLESSRKRITDYLAGLPNYDVVELQEQSLKEHAQLSAELDKNEAWSSFEMVAPGFD